ncbi:MAG: hypothetical protein RBS99_05175, partial [Rhodospirillales bacterium]|nr:hypothetical protein [Rhodospirillales bacterium]
YGWYLHGQIGDLTMARDNAVLQRDAASRQADEYAGIADRNARAVADLQAEHSRSLAAISKLHAEATARRTENESLKKELRDVAQTENRPVGPVLRSLLDGLRSDAVAGTASAKR